MEREAKKWFEIMIRRRRGVPLQKCQKMGLVKHYTLYGACFAEPDTFPVFEDYFGVFGGGTRLVMPKTICASDTSSLKPGSGATERVLD